MIITNLTFTSLIFIIFGIVVVLLYYSLPKYNWTVLLAASIAFYATWGVDKLPFVIISALISYVAAKRISQNLDSCEEHVMELKQNPDKKEEIKSLRLNTKKINKRILIVAIFLLLCMLIYVKAGKLMVEALSLSGVSIVVPLGISYYTFSLIGYLADCYWKKEKAESNFFKLLLFTIYFPKIIQGPISRHKQLGEQLIEKHKYEQKNFVYGTQLMLWGYFKKLVIADRLSIFVNAVYGDYEIVSGSMLFVATIFAAFQLYCDFSGCMDMACGFSEILGIKLDRNFNHPFFSESAAEFWRRWHITLGTWFKDYVYMPVSIAPWMMKLMTKVKQRFGMSVAKNVSTIISLLIVWLLTGIWHGTGLNYVIWGIYWGLLIILSMLLTPAFDKMSKKLRINTESGEWHLFRKLRTFLLFLISRLFTVPNNLEATWEVMRKIVCEFNIWELVDTTLYRYGLDRNDLAVAVISMIIVYLVSRYEEQNGKARDWLMSRQIVFRWIILYGLIFSIIIFGIYGPGYDASSFVYMQY